jgi:S-adenosylmethionine decarboxylase
MVGMNKGSQPVTRKIITPEVITSVERTCSKNVAEDYFVEHKGQVYAGDHLLVDLWGAKSLNDLSVIEQTLRAAVKACGATLLHIHLNQFSEGGGISGIVLLAESHMSIHTWPERGFASFDVFTCGSCQAENTLTALKHYLSPDQVKSVIHKRGLHE